MIARSPLTLPGLPRHLQPVLRRVVCHAVDLNQFNSPSITRRSCLSRITTA